MRFRALLPLSKTGNMQSPSQHLAHRAFLSGLAIAVIGAILFSTKAIVAKLIYRYHVDAVTLLAFRMLFSLPFFAAVALWKTRGATPLSLMEHAKIVVLGLMGYYLASFFDFMRVGGSVEVLAAKKYEAKARLGWQGKDFNPGIVTKCVPLLVGVPLRVFAVK